RRVVLHLRHVDDMALVTQTLLLEAQPHPARGARPPAVVKDHHGASRELIPAFVPDLPVIPDRVHARPTRSRAWRNCGAGGLSRPTQHGLRAHFYFAWGCFRDLAATARGAHSAGGRRPC